MAPSKRVNISTLPYCFFGCADAPAGRPLHGKLRNPPCMVGGGVNRAPMPLLTLLQAVYLAKRVGQREGVFSVARFHGEWSRRTGPTGVGSVVEPA